MTGIQPHADGSADGAEQLTTTQQKWTIAGNDVLRPVTLRQVLSARSNGSGVGINGRNFHTVRVVAMIRQETINKSYISYKLDDGTINPRQPVFASWASVNREGYEALLPPSNTLLPSLRYVSIVGRVDETKYGKMIRIDSLRPVVDPHEPYYHVLEVIKTELMYERGPPPGSIARNKDKSTPNTFEQEPQDVKGKGRQLETHESNSDDEMYETSMLKDHPTNTPAPARSISPPRGPRRSPHDILSEASMPHTPTKPSRSTRPQSPTSPSSVMGSLALRSPTSAAESSTATAQPRPSKSKGKGKSVDSESIPTPPVTESRRETKTAATARASRGTSGSSSPTRASTPSTSAESATTSHKTRRPRLSMKDPLSHLSLLQRSILLKIKEDTSGSSSGGTHIREIAKYVKQRHSQDNITYNDTIDAIEFLEAAGHIEAADDEFQYYRAKDNKVKRSAYDIPRE